MRFALKILLPVCCVFGPGMALMPDHYDMGPAYVFSPEQGDEVNTISFSNGFTIDTRTGESRVPDHLRISEDAGGEQYRIVSRVDEKVYINGAFSHRADILNRISVKVTDVSEGTGTLEATFQTSERAFGEAGVREAEGPAEKKGEGAHQARECARQQEEAQRHQRYPARNGREVNGVSGKR